MNLAQPEQLTFDRWVSDTYAQLRDAGVFAPQPPLEAEWREWSERLDEQDALDVPYHAEFATWQAWAERFVELNEETVS